MKEALTDAETKAMEIESQKRQLEEVWMMKLSGVSMLFEITLLFSLLLATASVRT